MKIEVIAVMVISWVTVAILAAGFLTQIYIMVTEVW